MSILSAIEKNLNDLKKLKGEIEKEVSFTYFPPRPDLPKDVATRYDEIREQAANEFLRFLQAKLTKYEQFYINTKTFAEKGEL